MLALAIITTILLGLFLIAFLWCGVVNLHKKNKVECTLLFVMAAILFFTIVTTWLLYIF